MSGLLRPFFSYYGSKWRAARLYPTPEHETIIEPFAGSAGYSLRFPDRKVILYDLNPVVCGVWDYLIRVSPTELRSLPATITHLDDYQLPTEAKWLIGFWLNKASTMPCKTPSSWTRSGVRPNSHWGEALRERLASQVEHIRHWVIKNDCYAEAEELEATWFVDPPYQCAAGRIYKFNELDYAALGGWCQSRRGQVIVCEQEGADWLPFEPLAKIKVVEGSRGKKYSSEVMWTKTDVLWDVA